MSVANGNDEEIIGRNESEVAIHLTPRTLMKAGASDLLQ